MDSVPWAVTLHFKDFTSNEQLTEHVREEISKNHIVVLKGHSYEEVSLEPTILQEKMGIFPNQQVVVVGMSTGFCPTLATLTLF